jgi:hypothetical protein
MDLVFALRIIVWVLALLIGPPALVVLGVAAWDLVTSRGHEG